MKTRLLIAVTVALTVSLPLAHAGTKDDASAAAKKLTDKGYSWKSTTDFGGGGGGGGGGRRGGFGGPQEGKVSADGVASVKISFGDTTTEAFIKGEKYAVNRGDGWKSGEELAPDQDGGGGRGRFAGAMFRNFKAPAARALEAIEQTKDLKSADGALSGDLTEEGAKSLMRFGGRAGGGGPEISGAKGSIKLWVKDGVLSKIETRVQGTISFNGNDREVDRTTTTEFKDVGTTTVTIPDDAKKKLS